MYDLFKARTRDFTCGLQRIKVMMESIVPYFEMEDGEVKKIELISVELGLGQKHSSIGWPRIIKDDELLKRFATLCEKFNTKVEIKGNKASIVL